MTGAALGWELVAGPAVRVHYLLHIDAPYGAPTLRIVAPVEARHGWSNVESDGTACLLPPGRNWMPMLHEFAIDMALNALRQIVVANLVGSDGLRPDQDPVAERHRWVGIDARAWSLLDLDGENGRATAARPDGRWVIASTPEVLYAWLNRRGLQEGERFDAGIVHVADFGEVPRELTSMRTAEKSIVKRGGIVVFAVPTETGPMLVGVYRKGSGALARVRVDRADRKWLHERGGTGLDPRLANARVAVVGGGSLGGGVAALLARAGVGRLTIIDPDVLSWDNVARHLLGAEAVGQPKASAIASRLREHLPTTPCVDGLSHTWQHVAAESPQELRADLIVSTIAAWPDELALAEWARLRVTRLVLGWIEPRGVAGHAVSLQGRCLGCQFTPAGSFRRTVAEWRSGDIVRLVDGCHEHYLPYGYADIVPTQGMIARLALEVLSGESDEPTHRALMPSLRTLEAQKARPSPDYLREFGSQEGSTASVERRRDWGIDPKCWHCGGAG